MAIVVIGGLITSTFLSLLVIPVVFTYVDDLIKSVASLTAKTLIALRPDYSAENTPISAQP
jgi:hypothetical protein